LGLVDDSVHQTVSSLRLINLTIHKLMVTIDPIVKKQRFLYSKKKNKKTFFLLIEHGNDVNGSKRSMVTHVFLGASY